MVSRTTAWALTALAEAALPDGVSEEEKFPHYRIVSKGMVADGASWKKCSVPWQFPFRATVLTIGVLLSLY